MQAQSRDVLLREMQHRVKNSFQIILASIAIQKRRYAARDAQRALDHITSRINAISLAHDQLAPHEKGQIVQVVLTERQRQRPDALETELAKLIHQMLDEIRDARGRVTGNDAVTSY
jgi:Histidine kinase